MPLSFHLECILPMPIKPPTPPAVKAKDEDEDMDMKDHAEADDDDNDDDDDDDYVWFRESDFEYLKGHLFRAGIRHLESLQKQIDQRKAADADADVPSREDLDTAGVLAASQFPTDEKALEYASRSISEALSALRGLIRETQGTPTMLGDGASLPELELALAGQARNEDLEGILNANYRALEVLQQGNAPLALHRVGLKGLWRFAKLPAATVAHIYPSEARMMSEAIGRVLTFLEGPKENYNGALAHRLYALLKRCGEQETYVIVGSGRV